MLELARQAEGGVWRLSPAPGLLIDWGGVLTSNLFASFQAYCLQAQIDPQTLRGRFSADPEPFRELLIALEKGELEEAAFELRFAALLGVEPDGLIDGLFAGVQPDTAMVEAVRRARAGGCARRSCRTRGASTATRTTCSTSCSTAS